jgi:hypothetical protein
MDIEEKIVKLSEKYLTRGKEDEVFGTAILNASMANKKVHPDDAIGYADWTASSEVLIVLNELLDFIDKSKEGVDDE